MLLGEILSALSLATPGENPSSLFLPYSSCSPCSLPIPFSPGADRQTKTPGQNKQTNFKHCIFPGSCQVVMHSHVTHPLPCVHTHTVLCTVGIILCWSVFFYALEFSGDLFLGVTQSLQRYWRSNAFSSIKEMIIISASLAMDQCFQNLG